jgi:nicotinate-nucleotide pyrophosphorylase
VTTDGTDRDGRPMHTEWTGKFDGKDYPLSGDPTADSRSYRKLNERVLLLANKKDGKAVTSGRIIVSADGKTRTLKVSGTDSSGKKVSSEAVYEKQ